jgi:hypothetical protein
MHRPAPHLTRPYQISFSPQAWSLVGSMAADTFKDLRAALDTIAQGKEEPSAEGASALRSATVGEWVVLYERDCRGRLLTVRTLVRRQNGLSSGK